MSTLTNHKKRKGGFSLIELLIVIAIFTIITTVALFDQGKLNSNVLLTNLAYDIALTVREAQSYGIGVKYSNEANSASGGYGVYINLTTLGQDTVAIFHDVVGDGIYNVSDDGAFIKQYQFLNQRGNHIAELCADNIDVGNPVGTVDCDKLTTGKKTNEMSISFRRPDPEANFRGDGAASFSGPAYIVLKSSDDSLCRAVVVEPSGQIRVEGFESEACSTPTP